MNSQLEGLFLHEIIFQCKTILAIFDLLSKALERDRLDNNLIWRAISLILTSTSNISRIFWPFIPKNIKNSEKEKYARYEERGKHLRDLLQIDSKSSLSNRGLRNSFEHYDERLHEWYEKSPQKALHLEISI